MIRELTDLGETSTLEADVCIVGAGAAGLALAAALLDTGWRVIVLESGRARPDAFGAGLNELESVGLPHDGGSDGRVRAFGGTTSAWGGQLLPLRASEIEQREWVPHSGWPITLDELQPFYRRVESLLGVEGPPYGGEVWNALGIQPPAFDASRFCVRFSQWAPLGRRNFAVLLRRRLAASRNVTVLLDATATAVHCGAGDAHVESVRCQSRAGKSANIRAAFCVLACGGLETPRLLLASPARGARGLANSSDLVGRFFQDHISYVAGEIEPRSRAELQRLFDPRYLARTMYTSKIEPSDATQRDRRWLNAMGHFAFEIPEALGLLEVKRVLRSFQSGSVQLPTLDELLAMLRGSGELARLVFARLALARRQSPSSGRIRLLVDVEQAPNPDSRITLGTRRDALGLPRAVLDWRLAGQELTTLTDFAKSLATELEAKGLGSVTLAAAPDFAKRGEVSAARDIFHHMGTTRMSRSPRDGVTNAELRCHDVDNLFVASSAVFPTGGIANPTLTIIALSLRLADHLKRLLAAAR